MQKWLYCLSIVFMQACIVSCQRFSVSITLLQISSTVQSYTLTQNHRNCTPCKMLHCYRQSPFSGHNACGMPNNSYLQNTVQLINPILRGLYRCILQGLGLEIYNMLQCSDKQHDLFLNYVWKSDVDFF